MPTAKQSSAKAGHTGAAKERVAPQVACPRCGQSSPYTAGNPFRPFCSERCKVLDLGAWASEQYKIAGSADDASSDPDANELL